MNKKYIWVALFAILAFSTNANASLVGDSVLVEWLYPDGATVLTSDTVTVGAGNEVICNGSSTFGCSFGGYGNGDVTFDIASFSIGMSLVNGATTFVSTTYNGFKFSGLDFSDGSILTNVVLDTNIAGLDMSRVAFGSDFVQINMQSLQTTDSYWNLSLVTTSTSVPEASSIMLLGLGLAGLGFTRRKKQS